MVTVVTPQKVAEKTDDTTEDWRTDLENTYAEGEPGEEDDFDLKGWRDSYSKQPLPRTDMLDWVTRTVDRITGTGARTFAEIGCGTGLLLLRLAPGADRYLGIDFSAKAIDQVKDAVAEGAHRPGAAGHGRRHGDRGRRRRRALRLRGDQLRRPVLPRTGLSRGGPRRGEQDRRSRRLHFRRRPEEPEAGRGVPRRCAGDGRPDRTEELRALAARHALEEDELLIDPGYFTELQDTLPAVTGIQVSLKAAGFDNEMTRFRYDVLLRISGEVPKQPLSP